MGPVLEKSAQALYEEDDLQIAEQALASNLKLIEGLLKNDPENRDLLLLAARGYAGYALGFAEDQNPKRAKRLYLRARDYALRILRRDAAFAQAEKQGLNALETYIKGYGPEQVPALFWAGFSWAGYVNLSLDNPEALLALPEIQILMERVERVQPDYFYGSVYLFFGSLYGMKPVIMGGDPQKALEYFRKNMRLNHNDFLLAQVYAAKFYAAKMLDESLFDSYLKHVLEMPIDKHPEWRLLNRIAKEKAKNLLAQKEDLF
jgi:TPR repeat protein